MAEKGKILVVDDDRLVLATVTHGLSQAGYEVIDADKLPQEYGGTLAVPVFPPSRTKKTPIAAGKEFRDSTGPVPAGACVTFKWFCRPGDMVWSVVFRPAAGGPDKVVGEGGASRCDRLAASDGSAEVREVRQELEFVLVELQAVRADLEG